MQGSSLMHLHVRYWPLYLHVCVFISILSSVQLQPTSNLLTDTPGKAFMTGHPTNVPTNFYGRNKNIAFTSKFTFTLNMKMSQNPPISPHSKTPSQINTIKQNPTPHPIPAPPPHHRHKHKLFSFRSFRTVLWAPGTVQ